MNIKRLEQYGSLKNEVKQLERRIMNLQSQEDTYIFDTASGSSVSFPYMKRSYKIIGVDDSKYKKINKIEKILTERKIKLDSELEEIETFVNMVTDSDIRQIIQYKYIDGLSWTATATKVYGYPCGDRARMGIKRFIEKI